MSRPEAACPPDLYYDETEARKYDSSSRIIHIQREITNRALEMLNLPEDRPSYILDIGCGSGLSGLALEESGHYWIGCDISRDMLDVANQRENEKGDLLLSDMGQGLPFRAGTFDGVVSVSALQWLCYSNSSEQNPLHRLVFTFIFYEMN
jgi:18S rRNA (guanine1575-N7)-methyltransferase